MCDLGLLGYPLVVGIIICHHNDKVIVVEEPPAWFKLHRRVTSKLHSESPKNRQNKLATGPKASLGFSWASFFVHDLRIDPYVSINYFGSKPIRIEIAKTKANPYCFNDFVSK